MASRPRDGGLKKPLVHQNTETDLQSEDHERLLKRGTKATGADKGQAKKDLLTMLLLRHFGLDIERPLQQCVLILLRESEE